MNILLIPSAIATIGFFVLAYSSNSAGEAALLTFMGVICGLGLILPLADLYADRHHRKTNRD